MIKSCHFDEERGEIFCFLLYKQTYSDFFYQQEAKQSRTFNLV